MIQAKGLTQEFLWVEKYRPHTVKECILPDRLKVQFQAFVDKGLIPNLLLSGGPGIGKTTIAKAMCDEIGLSYLLLNSSSDRGISTFRDQVARYASVMSFDGRPKVVILDEADNITLDAQAAFRGMVEEYSGNCTFVLTCNYKSKLLAAIPSRCIDIDFNLQKSEKQDMAAAFMKRCKEILTTENISFDKMALAKVVMRFFPDYRRILGELQNLSLSDGIKNDVVDELLSADKLETLYKALAEKDFKTMRAWVGTNDVQSQGLFEKIYTDAFNILDSSDVPMAVMILAKYQYQDAFVANKEINLIACLTELMAECKFKLITSNA